MAYFNHAYVKAAVIDRVKQDAATPTSDLTAGELGLIDATTYETIATGTPGFTVPSEFLLAFGNYNQTDTIGGNPLHGGYAESIKTKIIKPNYINALWIGDCVDAASEVIQITVPDDCIACDGSTSAGNQLRIDLKGDEVLRYLNRFSYVTLDYRECCETGTEVPGATVVAAWVDKINNDPLLSPFITASAVTGGSTDNVLNLVIDYTATFFDNCSYDTRDWNSIAPLTAIVSAVDDDGDACTNTCMTAKVGQTAVTDFGLNVATAVSTKAETSGETVIKEIILEGRYRQDGGWNQGNKDSARFREIQNGDALLGCGSGAVDRTAFYKCYYLQHSVPRFNNPTGVFDNDQYLYKFYVDCTDESANTAVAAIWTELSTASGVNVLEPLR